MKKLEEMTKAERSLLLFFESAAVEKSGRFMGACVNSDDMAIADQWMKEGFITYGRIKAEFCNSMGQHWVHLSEAAHVLAADERKARAKRMWESRTYKTTGEIT